MTNEEKLKILDKGCDLYCSAIASIYVLNMMKNKGNNYLMTANNTHKIEVDKLTDKLRQYIKIDNINQYGYAQGIIEATQICYECVDISDQELLITKYGNELINKIINSEMNGLLPENNKNKH